MMAQRVMRLQQLPMTAILTSRPSSSSSSSSILSTCSTAIHRSFSSASAPSTESSASATPAATTAPRRPPGYRRYRYVPEASTATYQAMRRFDAKGNLIKQPPASTQPTDSSSAKSSPSAKTPIETVIDAESAARTQASRTSQKQQSGLSIPEGSLPYSGRSSPQTNIPTLPDSMFALRAPGVEFRGERKRLAIAPQKLNDICRPIRGLSCDEAMLQLTHSEKKKAYHVRHAIAQARAKAVREGLNKERLYVNRLWVGHGTHLKRVDIKGRGRSGMKRKYRAHVYCTVKEQEDTAEFEGEWKYGGLSHDPRTGQEIRIGRRGRKIETIQRTKAAMVAWREARGMAPKPAFLNKKEDAKKAFASYGVATDLEAIFGKAATSQ